MSKTICFLNIISDNTHATKKICKKKNLYEYSNMVQLNYTISKYKDGICIDIKTYEEKITSRLLYNSNNFIYNIEDVLDKFIENIKDVDIIVSYDVINEFNTLLTEIIRHNCSVDLSNYYIISVNDFFKDNTLFSLNELYINTFKKESLSNINMLKELFFDIYTKNVGI